MAASSPVIQLSDLEEATLLGLSFRDPAAVVQATLEQIAKRHNASWRDWQRFSACPLQSESLLSWLSSCFESQAYEALVEFSFRTFYSTLNDTEAILGLFGHFADSIHTLAQLQAMRAEPEAGRAKDRGCNAIASMIVAAGPSGARFALAAVDAKMFSRKADWMARSWAIARTDFESAELADISPVPDRTGGSKRA